jgi:CRISPR/Cas system-associated exonuclease Cas4 (RecB family)
MPAIIYELSNGIKVPGTTTIISNNLSWNKNALVGWAYNQGKAGKPLRDQEALDIGSIIHKWVEADIKGKDFKMPDITSEIKEKVENSFMGYLEWKDQVKFKLLKSELSLISETYEFGGTIDIIGEVNGQPSIIDLKTSDQVYVDHKIQVAAYKMLYNENFLMNEPITMVYILKLGKKDGGFSYHYLPNLRKEEEVFLLLLELEKYRKEIG